MPLTTRFSRFHQTGFSLIELMVGLAIGMLATIVIIQVMTVFESQRRTTTGSADAQTNGGIALHSITREVQMGGYPLLPITDSALECTTLNVRPGATGVTGISPVTITDGVAVSGVSPASDSITIRYGTSPMGGAITQIGTIVDAPNKVVTVGNHLGCRANDITLISFGTTCAMSSTTELTTTTVPGTPPTYIYNLKLTDLDTAATNANLGCMGNWIEVTYAVNQTTGNLDRTVRVNGVSDGTVVNGVTTGTAPSVVGVVNLQAQYGISATANSNKITEWVDASGGTWAAPTVANRNRIKAVRVAVVARNAKIEPEIVTTACSSPTAAAPTGLCAWPGIVTVEGTVSTVWPAPTIALSPGNANWARYRYRVFETIIPLRNVIWSKDTL